MLVRRDDLALMPLSEFIVAMAGFRDDTHAPPDGIVPTAVELDLPVELDVERKPDGTVHLGGGPPTQKIETSVMPVFHRLAVRIIATEAW